MIARFAEPWMLLSLLGALAVLLARMRRGGAAYAPFPLTRGLARSRGPLAWRALLALGLALCAFSLARPQWGREQVEHTQSGRDLVLVIDTSRSMEVDDLVDADGLRSDRLAAVFAAARQFISRRPDDRVGLVFFATHAVTGCPLTFDHVSACDILDRTEGYERKRWAAAGAVAGEGGESGFLGDATNIGLALGFALRSLDDPAAKGRAIVLITDGADSRTLPTWIDPLAAARHARQLGVTIYGIGVGDPQGQMTNHYPDGSSELIALTPIMLPDMERLAAITDLAGGQAFHANDQVELGKVLGRIDQLEPTERATNELVDWSDRWQTPLGAGALCLVLAMALGPLLRGSA